MTEPLAIQFRDMDTGDLGLTTGRIAIFVAQNGRATVSLRVLSSGARQAITRLLMDERWDKAAVGDCLEIGFPAGMAAESLLVIKLPGRPSVEEARKAGGTLARLRGTGDLAVLGGKIGNAAEIAFGLVMRAYDFTTHKTTPAAVRGAVRFHVADPEATARASAAGAALAEGVFFARDLVNEPANILTTDDFAARLAAMQETGLDVEIIEEEALRDLGMNLLLSVGQGSESPSKVVVMRWNGGGDEAPFALVGKGVVFDTGGISLKPAAGMEEMTMDMGGAATVAGTMRALALRKARANVVGLVGIVENMPSGHASRPGDVVRSMKGDTVENINTDAEGRLVLADVLWYTQERFKPSGIVNLATLTGAMVVALGHEYAGMFANDDRLADRLLAAAKDEGEGLWRMPLGQGYADTLKSRIADFKNVGGREGGACIAAEFLRKFIQDGMPWAHLDIAGTALARADRPLGPKGATGWGVLALNRLVADHYENG